MGITTELGVVQLGYERTACDYSVHF